MNVHARFDVITMGSLFAVNDGAILYGLEYPVLCMRTARLPSWWLSFSFSIAALSSKPPPLVETTLLQKARSQEPHPHAPTTKSRSCKIHAVTEITPSETALNHARRNHAPTETRSLGTLVPRPTIAPRVVYLSQKCCTFLSCSRISFSQNWVPNPGCKM